MQKVKSMYPVRFKKHKNSPFNSLFDDLFNHSLGDFHGGASADRPAVNIRENAERFILDVAAPGFTKNSFEVNVEKNLLTVSGNLKEEKYDGDEGNWSRREFQTANFKRSFRLPNTIDTDSISAVYENGILGLTLPKKSESVDKPARTITIQ